MRTSLAPLGAALLLAPAFAGASQPAPAPADKGTMQMQSSTPTPPASTNESSDPCSSSAAKGGAAAKGAAPAKNSMTGGNKPESVAAVTKDTGGEAPAAKTKDSKSDNACDAQAH